MTDLTPEATRDFGTAPVNYERLVRETLEWTTAGYWQLCQDKGASLEQVASAARSWFECLRLALERCALEREEAVAALDAERARNRDNPYEHLWREALARAEAAEARNRNLEEALADAGVDPVDYILSRPSYEEREEAAKCLYAAAVLADGYGKKETARRFRKAGAGLKTRRLDVNEDSE